MPTYQYACTECGHSFDVVQSFSEDSLSVCPECGGRLRKVYNAVGVVFKGSGFYRTDSREKKPSGASSSDGGGQEHLRGVRLHRLRLVELLGRRLHQECPGQHVEEDHGVHQVLTGAASTRPPVDGRSRNRFRRLGSGAMTPLLTASRRRLAGLRRRLLLHRRSLAALCAGTAVLVGLQAVSPAPPASGRGVDRLAGASGRRSGAAHRPGPDRVRAGQRARRRRCVIRPRWSGAPSPHRWPAANR